MGKASDVCGSQGKEHFVKSRCCCVFAVTLGSVLKDPPGFRLHLVRDLGLTQRTADALMNATFSYSEVGLSLVLSINLRACVRVRKTSFEDIFLVSFSLRHALVFAASQDTESPRVG